MRIISGLYKGRKLMPVRGKEIRPTGGKVREAIFSILARDIAHARILDLFAGTGAFGLEALSRGAARAVFIESDDRAIAAIKKNIRLCRAEKQAQCIKWDITRDLNCIRSLRPGFDVAFMDPPYQGDFIAPALKNLAESNGLENGAVIAIEHSAKAPLPEIHPPFYVTDRRRYGKTLVTFLNFMIERALPQSPSETVSDQ
ncbi:MAG: 16S rRNA (guanine(966)-N(2))-methyltransferase RsmD [Desulfobacterales bacterium]|nr:16S rRNA (guanine(966)-N(2))-methyltransferase RsmD [Desulfobacterales bacterium]